MSAVETGSTVGLAERLRTATSDAHDRAERAPFVTALMDGRLDRSGYAMLLGQNWHLYQVLEAAGRSWQGDPVAGRFVDPALDRTAVLAADLGWLLGPEWLDQVPPLPSTQQYVARLRAVAFTSTSRFVAHHYTRYLGDLSGGQIIRSRLRTNYGLYTDGVRSYVFDGIDRPKRYKDAYRRLLDEAPWNPQEQEDLMDEANGAFDHGRAVFDDLAVALGLVA